MGNRVGRLVAAFWLAGAASCAERGVVDDAPAVEDTAAAEVPQPTAEAGGAVDCSALPVDLIQQVARDYQLVVQLDPERNLQTMAETVGLPDPDALRTFADAFGRLDVAGVEAGPFDPPSTTAAGQRRLADLLEAALEARDDAAAPSWSALRAFVSEHATSQQLSMSYHLSEAGCVD